MKTNWNKTNWYGFSLQWKPTIYKEKDYLEVSWGYWTWFKWR